MKQGIFHLLLHAHLPFVRHPEEETCLAESWFFEALIESYIPMLMAFDRMADDGIDFQLNFSLSPTLLSMLDDELLKERFFSHCARVKAFILEDYKRVSTREERQLIHWYEERMNRLIAYYEQSNADIISRFVDYSKKGNIELLTTSATHAVLPLYQNYPSSIEAQVYTGLEYFEEKTQQKSRGFWLPECAYHTGVESLLEKAGVEYFYLETTALSGSQASYSSPVRLASGSIALARDPMCSELVWSSKKGYPGHSAYREYYSERIHELSDDAAKDFLLKDGSRIASGLKYKAVTGGAEKVLYSPTLAKKMSEAHAKDFCIRMERAVKESQTDPLFVAPYDAELFGHWWFEGPNWLEAVFREIQNRPSVQSMTGSTLCEQLPSIEITAPKASSWGKNADYSFWVSKENNWIYPLIFDAEKRFVELLQGMDDLNALQRRTVRQIGRSLLLAQSSDWPFILKNQTVVAYAKERLQSHLANIHFCLKFLESGNLDIRVLQAIETMEFIFLDLRFDFWLKNENLN